VGEGKSVGKRILSDGGRSGSSLGWSIFSAEFPRLPERLCGHGHFVQKFLQSLGRSTRGVGKLFHHRRRRSRKLEKFVVSRNRDILLRFGGMRRVFVTEMLNYRNLIMLIEILPKLDRVFQSVLWARLFYFHPNVWAF
jgi:hypothetical protein